MYLSCVFIQTKVKISKHYIYRIDIGDVGGYGASKAEANARDKN